MHWMNNTEVHNSIGFDGAYPVNSRTEIGCASGTFSLSHAIQHLLPYLAGKTVHVYLCSLYMLVCCHKLAWGSQLTI